MPKKISLIIVFCMAITMCPVQSYAANAGPGTDWPTYTYREKWDGKLGNTPVINSIVDPEYNVNQPEFLRVREASSNKDYQYTDYNITKENRIAVAFSVINNNDIADAKDVRVSLSFGKDYADKFVVTATITTGNASPRTYVDTITIFGSKDFKLSYTDNSNLLYNETNNFGKNGGPTQLSKDIFTEKGVPVSSGKVSGTIAAGKSASVVAILTVARKGEVIESFSDLKYRKVDKFVKPGKKGTMLYSHAKAWNLVQKHSNPSIILKRKNRYGDYKGSKYRYISYKKSDKNYKYLKKQALRITKNCKNDYEKIYAIATAVAKRTYYHSVNAMKVIVPTNLAPHKVWKKKKSVCQGYSNLNEVMLNSIGIPCFVVTGDNHAYNAAYSKSKKRWVFYDSTWMSENKYTKEGKWIKGESLDLDKFDMPCEYMADKGHHQIYLIYGIKKGNVIYNIITNANKKKLPAMKKAFEKGSGWYAMPAYQYKKKSTLKIAAKVAGNKVERIYSGAFANKNHIRKIYLPKTIKKIEDYAFFAKWKGKRVKTTVITKIPRKKLNLKKGWGNRNVKIKGK